MSFCTTLNPPIVGPASPKWSQFRSSTVIAIAKPTTTHQGKVKEGRLDLKDTVAAVSRRNMMSLTGLSLAVFYLSSPDPAEARMTRTERKNKILKKLREKVGVLKPSDENEEQTSKPEQEMSVSQEDER